MTDKTTIYISVDVEADGPTEGVNSMLSLGAVALRGDDEIATWSANLYPLPGCVADPNTTIWWESQPEAWEIVRWQQRQAEEAIPEFATWCEQFPKRIGIAWPVGYDMPFIRWYCLRFAGRIVLRNWLDIRSYAMGVSRSPGYFDLNAAAKAVKPDKTGLTEHVALDDAIEQARLFRAFVRFGSHAQ